MKGLIAQHFFSTQVDRAREAAHLATAEQVAVVKVLAALGLGVLCAVGAVGRLILAGARPHGQVVAGVPRAERVEGQRAVACVAAQHDALAGVAQRAGNAPALRLKGRHALHRLRPGPRLHLHVWHPQRTHLPTEVYPPSIRNEMHP